MKFLSNFQSLRLSLVLAICVGFSSSASAEDTSYYLDNGLQVILKENHSSPMVTSMVFVKSASKYESTYENGITHFLEHLLFDGTTSRTNEELDKSIRDLGGYINAFTRKDLTAYLVLLPQQYIDFGMTVQADMLFHSVFPEAQIDKERKVVIEEMKRSDDSPGSVAEKFFTHHAYAETAYAQPVLGYQSFIENIPREAIVAYWQKFYTPDNMILLVIGDFETEAMKKQVAEVFGRYKKASADLSAAEAHEQLADGKSRAGRIVGANRFDTLANVTTTYVNFSFEAPSLGSDDYLPIDLLVSYLNLDEVSPLKNALLAGDAPLATEVGVSLVTHEEFCRLEVSVMTDSPDNRDQIVATILAELALLQDHQADRGAITGIKTSAKCDAIYYEEKLHYYGFIVAPLLMTAGWEFAQQYPDLLTEVTWESSAEAASRWLTGHNYVVTTVRPVPDSISELYLPVGLTAEDVIGHFDTTQFAIYEIAADDRVTYPPADEVSFDYQDQAGYYREILSNGLTLIVKFSPDSRVFAANVLGKNRTLSEPSDKEGITDFVNRCLDKSTTSRSGADLTKDLAKIGANLTLSDNPWIPYDDRYTTRRFSFIKFETIDRYAQEGVELLADLLQNPAFDSSEVESVRRSMLSTIGRDGTSPVKVARQLFYEQLFGEHPFAQSISGTEESIAAITRADLMAHHHRYYSPSNMILTVATSRDSSEVLPWLRDMFGRTEPVNVSILTAALASPTAHRAHRDMEKEQIGIYVGGLLPPANSEDEVDLSVATAILSARLYSQLRERQGLAYSTGAGIRFDNDFGWYFLTIGTGCENYAQALSGLKLQTEKLAFDGPTEDEVRIVKNQIWGRLMSAKLSRINQAYYLGVDEYFNRQPGHDREFLDLLKNVTAGSVSRVAQRYFRPESWVVTTAGSIPE